MGRKCLSESGPKVPVSLKIAPDLKMHYQENGKTKLIERLLREDKNKQESE